MLMRQNSIRVVICGMDMLVLCDNVGSIWMDGATDTDVKRALTSKEVMTFPGSSICPVTVE